MSKNYRMSDSAPAYALMIVGIAAACVIGIPVALIVLLLF